MRRSNLIGRLGEGIQASRAPALPQLVGDAKGLRHHDKPVEIASCDGMSGAASTPAGA